MSSTHLTGVDERVEIVVGGTLLTVFADVTDFNVDDDIDEISYKPLGRSGTVKSQDFAGHSGTLTVIDASPVIETTRQAIMAAQVGRVPLPVNIVHVIKHKQGPVRSYTYTDCKITFGRQVQREQGTQVTINWTTGNLRLET